MPENFHMQGCFFEDQLSPRFQPLTLTRPVDDLRVGLLTIAQKWKRALSLKSYSRLLRNELSGVFEAAPRDETPPACWINSRFLPSPSLVDKVKALDTGTAIMQGDTMVAARPNPETAQKWRENGQPDVSDMLVIEGHNFRSLSHLWDLFLLNEEEIINDLELLNQPSSTHTNVSDHALLENETQIHLGEGATVEAGAILLAGDGPVFIGNNATLMAGAMVRGPAAICPGATVKMGAKIYPGTTIGPVCKVGGEISHSIFHSYSNKGHDGFVGNSLIGPWCNLGADTNTSNLKNNYSPVRITEWASREEIETGQQFLGAVLGDHTKTAINTQLNTGTVCGVSCNIFADDFPPKFIPSFSWVGSNVIQPYKMDKALEAMQAMMARRDVELSDDYEHMMRTLFEKEHG